MFFSGALQYLMFLVVTYTIYLLSLLSALFSLLILSLLFVFRCHRIDNAMYNYYIISLVIPLQLLTLGY